MGRCDWCGQGHTRCDTGTVLLFCQGQTALRFRGALLPEARRLYSAHRRVLPPLSEPGLTLSPLIFGPTAALSADLSDSFINTVGENEADLADDIEAFPPRSRQADALLADDDDALDDNQPGDMEPP